ncbi:N-acetylmuramoyl-L-alanine amidase [Nonomuraea sp. NPDC059194]|uniref:N-acetylmuramoyl-L-alanine amidase n=1 Tax=Nonomuraea sp. NPDC059194 TaxID=3346764 RepID=UPI00369D03C3
MLLWVAAALLVALGPTGAVTPEPGGAAAVHGPVGAVSQGPVGAVSHGQGGAVSHGRGAQGPGGAQEDFRAAAEEYGVPESVLLGVSYLESRWDTHGWRPSVSGGYGPMHLTDAEAVPEAGHHHTGDPRGDDTRPMHLAAAPPVFVAQGEQTLQRAARLTGLPPERLRRDRAANIRGGAALLADQQRRLGAPLSPDPLAWHEAVARYASPSFAHEVLEVMRAGVERRTDDGSLVRLHATPVPALRIAAASAASPAECPATLACEWMPAAYKRFDKDDYGNHDRMTSPREIDYIVIHDTEGSYGGIPSLVKNPKYVSWHYTIRSKDGHVAQHVLTKDVAWHAGNWDVNTRSIGIEHEGFLAEGGSWYTEAMYRSSAELVRYLATKYDVPLDRAHIIGHDNVPGATASAVPGMHDDPGPYWDWGRFLAMMEAPIEGGESGQSVIIKPDYGLHRPTFVGCFRKRPHRQCRPQGATSVWLRTEPRDDAPLVADIGQRRTGSSTYSVYDQSARASVGQRYALAETSGDWTAIWYLGQKAWFRNPPSQPTAVRATGPLVTPVRDKVKVYGRAYPERSAYPRGVAYQEHTPLPYTLHRGQFYSLGQTLRGTYLKASHFKPAKHVTVRGKLRYHQIQLGHRVMFVKADDVRVVS